ncbi:protein kinase domain containing protein [Acanthamoeba castellanii str. Neff]|uniref:non-specific serine/threonine protein kinase n=1 Tax=Acanthamoeba castellanii (strain ATCC 30010 / Neff) TaxID=1257118 RepID=L8HCX7_ACACF|nr:protein kinase domain containing protein [Acanthamoeba castellanii str. Neff]ELR22246.1 protein kinase domain containing protein [Acanthamoeba castellanii str. Neff]
MSTSTSFGPRWRVAFYSLGTNLALSNYGAGYIDFMCLDRGIPAAQAAQYGDLAQFPIAGQALVLAYNISTLGSTDPLLILDRDTVGRIFAGNISMWDDQAIQDLNPLLVGKLPPLNITIGYSDNAGISVPEVFKRALVSFSPLFSDALDAAGGLFSAMPPALRGTGFSAGTSSTNRLTWLKARTNAITFVSYADAVTSGVKYAQMYNRENVLVTASSTTVQSAMAAFLPEFGQSNFTVDIYDAEGTNSWPLALMSYVSLNRDVTAVDCNVVRELLNFVAWIHTNDGASQALLDLNFVPLDVTLRKRLIDLLNTVACNNEQAYTTNYLVGVGPALPLYTGWSVARSSSLDNKVKYYLASASTEAPEQLASYDSDFGASNSGVNSSWLSTIPDLAVLPITAYATVPGYNIPELKNHTLVFTFEILAGIYMNNITMWDDYRIKAVNTAEVAALLPAQVIYVCLQSTASETTLLFTSVLSAVVPEFAAAVGSGSLVSFPVQVGTGNRTQSAADAQALVRDLIFTSYAIGFVRLDAIKLSSKYLAAASLRNPAGNVVAPNTTTVTSAINDFLSNSSYAYESLALGPGANSWPLATFGSFFYHQSTMQSCAKAKALADFFYWTQTDSNAVSLADTQGYILALTIEPVRRQFLTLLKEFTCDDVSVSSIAPCINDGTLCSDAGTCTENVGCVCNTGRTGTYCQDLVADSSSTNESLIVALSVALPAAAVLFLLLACIILLLLLVLFRRRDRDDWEIQYEELEVGDVLGTGGFGEVYRALWKGTEVAVKVMASEKASKDMERSFKDEVRVMTALRHPNVVLFMAACTKPPKMCIVMEFMSLGSLYDLLHNELIPEIPFALKVKVAYQASKGMHFLHSSGIVHRDLKSLNLLLDSKWNVKVSDFGLTKFKEDMKKGDAKNMVGSVHWTAPEILQETPDYTDIITNCWHTDPSVRPTFLEVMTRLSGMVGDATGGASASFTSTSSKGGKSIYGSSWSVPGSSTNSTNSRGSKSSQSSNSSQSGVEGAAAATDMRPPEGDITIVFTDISRAASLWEFNPIAMRDATVLHNGTLRGLLKRHRGYEEVTRTSLQKQS